MLHLVVALECEAEPLRRHFGLRATGRASTQSSNSPFKLYEGEDLRLVVSGMGQALAAAAVAWLAGRHEGAPRSAWLNVGTAGHALRPVGEGVLAHKVCDAATGECWYPGLVFAAPAARETLLTVARPEREYRHAAAYEMEAAGFCRAAARFAPWELIHCYKVISDNRHQPVHEVNADRVRAWMADNLPAIERLVTTLQGLARQLAAWEDDPPLLDWMSSRWRFSHTRRARLHALLRRHAALGRDSEALRARLRYCRDAAAALAQVEAAVDAAAGTTTQRRSES